MNKTTKIITIAFFLTAFIPSIAFAAWWNPIDWFSDQTTQNIASSTTDQVSALNAVITSKDEEIAQLEAEVASSTGQAPLIQKKTVTQTVTVKDPTEEADIANLTTQLAKAQTQYALCQGQLSSASSAANTTNANSAQIKSIETELGVLSQIDFDIDNAPLQLVGNNASGNSLTGTTTLISVLNNSVKLDGTPLFPNVVGEWYVTSLGLQPTTSTSTLHAVVQSYRTQLQGELETDGGVNENMNLSQ
jgi:hypothetical protein